MTSCARPGSGRGGETVAGAAHRLQASGIVTEFATEGADHDLDDVAAVFLGEYELGVAEQEPPSHAPFTLVIGCARSNR